MQRVPKKAGTKSALLYDQYKGAESIRDMLALGARRADIPYDISHGWVTLVDPTLQKRFSPPPTAAAAARSWPGANRCCEHHRPGDRCVGREKKLRQKRRSGATRRKHREQHQEEYDKRMQEKALEIESTNG